MISKRKKETSGRGHNYAKQTQFFDCGLRIGDCGFRKACGPPPGLAGPPVQTKPIPGYAGRDGTWGTWDEGCCTNKPNWPPWPGDPPAPALRRSVVQTNPVGPRRAGKTIAKAGGLDAATRHTAQTCKTKPISGGTGGTRALYKQTQFLPLCRSSNRRSREGKSCETKPNLGGLGDLRDGAWMEPVVRNEANSRHGRAILPRRSTRRPVAPVGRLYKQTQLARRGPGGGGWRSCTNKTRPTKVRISRTDPWYRPRNAGRIPTRGLLSRASNKANSRRCRAGRGRRDEGRGVLYKQSQFGPGRAAWGQACGTRAEGCCTNKPNSCHYADPEIGVPGGHIVQNEPNSQGSSRSDGDGTCHCVRSAAIRHHRPAPPARRDCGRNR